MGKKKIRRLAKKKSVGKNVLSVRKINGWLDFFCLMEKKMSVGDFFFVCWGGKMSVEKKSFRRLETNFLSVGKKLLVEENICPLDKKFIIRRLD